MYSQIGYFINLAYLKNISQNLVVMRPASVARFSTMTTKTSVLCVRNPACTLTSRILKSRPRPPPPKKTAPMPEYEFRKLTEASRNIRMLEFDYSSQFLGMEVYDAIPDYNPRVTEILRGGGSPLATPTHRHMIAWTCQVQNFTKHILVSKVCSSDS
jgi:hypothetical protein